VLGACKHDVTSTRILPDSCSAVQCIAVVRTSRYFCFAPNPGEPRFTAEQTRLAQPGGAAGSRVDSRLRTAAVRPLPQTRATAFPGWLRCTPKKPGRYSITSASRDALGYMDDVKVQGEERQGISK